MTTATSTSGVTTVSHSIDHGSKLEKEYKTNKNAHELTTMNKKRKADLLSSDNGPENGPEKHYDEEEVRYVRDVSTQVSKPLRVVICVVCNDREALHVFVPCGHRNTCIECLHSHQLHNHSELFGPDTKCPICKKLVEHAVELFE